MLIYSQADKKAIDRAVAKARQVKPRVKTLDFGKFEVTGSEGQPYEVTFSKQDGQFVVSCTCPANAKGNKPCYHAASVGGIFKQQVAERAAAKAAQTPADMPDCNACQRLGCPICFPPSTSLLDVADPDEHFGECGKERQIEVALAAACLFG